MKKLITIILCGFLLGCTKEYLDVKPEKSLVVPSKLQDFRALLDNTSIMNISQPYLGEISSGDFILLPGRFSKLSADQRNAVIWAKDIFESESTEDWDWSYRRIFFANRVLEGIEEIEPSGKTQKEWNEIKGTALFHRASGYFNLAQLFCKQYDNQTSSEDPGLPLRLRSDINLPSKRATVKETYDQILADLNQSLVLLPETVSFKTRPSTQAGYALLASVYLQMEDYEKALHFANLALKVNDKLLDFNLLDRTTNFPLTRFNDEVIFHSTILHVSAFAPSGMAVNPEVLALFEGDDLRKEAFFIFDGPGSSYKGSYGGEREFFNGCSTNEIYLIAAECYARQNQVGPAMNLLNLLREKRWRAGNYTPLMADDSESALKLVLEERRRELLFRGKRWSDLRRLNKDPRFAVTVNRSIDDQTYSLPANDPRYVLPLPPVVIALTHMEQNPR